VSTSELEEDARTKTRRDVASGSSGHCSCYQLL